MDKNLIVLILAVVLVVVAGIQAVQINEIKESVNEGEITGRVVQASNVQGSARQQAAPTMVGGC